MHHQKQRFQPFFCVLDAVGQGSPETAAATPLGGCEAPAAEARRQFGFCNNPNLVSFLRKSCQNNHHQNPQFLGKKKPPSGKLGGF